MIVISWAVVVLAAAVGVGRYVAMTSAVGIGVVALAPWSLVPAWLAVGTLAVLARWRPAASAGLVIALISVPQVATYIPDQRPDAGPITTVMTANTRHGAADPQALVANVQEQGVEILALQELTSDSIEKFTAAGLDDVLPYRSIAVQPGGTDVGL